MELGGVARNFVLDSSSRRVGRIHRPRARGGTVEPQLKKLMKELGEAINESLAESDQISEVVTRIKDGGYDIFLVLEATIGFAKQGDKSEDGDKTTVSTRGTGNSLTLNEQDQKFLKSLRIKIENLG
jgi:hypothetical protein